MAIEYEFSGILHRNEREMLDAIAERWITSDGSNAAAFVADYLKGASDLAIAQECIDGWSLNQEGEWLVLESEEKPAYFPKSHMARNDYTSAELAQAVGRFRSAFSAEKPQPIDEGIALDDWLFAINTFDVEDEAS